MTQIERIVLASRPQGSPVAENFRHEAFDLADPAEGEVQVRTIWLSLDPYMRGRMDDVKSYADPVPIGGTMEAGAVGVVTQSKHADFGAGDIVLGRFGWASGANAAGSEIRKVDPSIAPISTALGVLGMPGHTAWVGLNDILQAKSGETIVVSAATGAVGSLVGQLAKHKGMRTIGVAGGAEKCAFAKEELGYDVCFDHKALDTAELTKQIADAAPNGVDTYYENVGGKTLEAALANINTFGRIAVCGMISWYSGQGIDQAIAGPKIWRAILTRRLRVQGFIIFDHNDRHEAFVNEVAPLVKDGSVRFRETVTDGLENAPAAFMSLLKGGNFGKQLVRVGPDPT